MTEEKKTKWCYSVNEENFNGSYDTEEEAHSEAQQHRDYDMEVGDTAEYWIGNPKPAEEFLRPDMVGQSIAEQVDEWLAHHIGWGDQLFWFYPTRARQRSPHVRASGQRST